MLPVTPAAVDPFSQAGIDAAVKEAFVVATDIPSGHRGAFLTIVNESGVQAVVAEKVGNIWTVTASVGHPWSGGLDYGCTIQTTW